MTKKRKKHRARAELRREASASTTSASTTSASTTSASTSRTGTLLGLFDAYFFAPVAAARPYLLVKSVLVLLGFDAFVVMVEHGGRYGIGDFNVAHFGVLDALQPTPTPAIYVGTVLMAGLLALFLVLARPTRLLFGILLTLYTYGWAMSQLDSYQHHYLISLLLACFVCLPPESGADLERRHTAERDTSIVAWAYPLTALTIAVVYLFTAVAKIEDDWRLGHALQRITASTGTLAPFEAYFVELGMSPSAFWELVGTSVVVLQVVIFAGYATAPMVPLPISRPARTRGLLSAVALLAGSLMVFSFARDATAAFLITCTAGTLGLFALVPALRWIAFGAAVSFHVGAEILELKIGWFSYYMLLTPLVFFLPDRWLTRAALAMSAPARRLRAMMAQHSGVDGSKADGSRVDGSRVDGSKAERSMGFEILILALASSGLAGLLGHMVDLPGSLAAGLGLGVLMIGTAVYYLRQSDLAAARGALAAGAIAALSMWVATTQSDVRYDYYRFVGGDARRRGEHEKALAAYIKANAYLVRPFCVYQSREKIACYRSESRAESAAEELDGASVRRNDRREKEEEMRRILGR